MMPVMPAPVAVIVMRPVISSLVTIDIVQIVPAQIEIIAKMAVPVPAVKPGVVPQPVRIMMTVPDVMVPLVCDVTAVMTSMCQSLRYYGDEHAAR